MSTWRQDLGPARAGDAEAKQRLREFLTPFAHAVALAHAPHHLVEPLMPRLLDEATALGAVPDVSVGAHVLATARRVAKQAAPMGPAEQSTSDAAAQEARKTLARLRALPEAQRECFLLRVLEGIPGPELSEVTGAPAAQLRGELERASAEAARALGQSAPPPNDGYLWDLAGAPTPLLAQLEMVLPVLRHQPGAPLPPRAEASSGGTFEGLQAVGGGAPTVTQAPAVRRGFDEHESTAVGAPPPNALGPNPFDAARTLAASDLPAEARGQVPGPVPTAPPTSDPNLRSLRVPPRGDGSAAAGSEVSGKSNSGKARGESSGKTRRPDAMRSGLPFGAGQDETRSEVPPPIARAQQQQQQLEQQAEVATHPEARDPSVLGRPTMQMPLSQAVGMLAGGETRVVPIPTPAADDEETAKAKDPRRAAPPPGAPGPDGLPRLWSPELLRGATPVLVAAVLFLGGWVLHALGFFAMEKDQKSSWNLTEVVVAAEELPEGAVITLENVAIRSIPDLIMDSEVILASKMGDILHQRLAVPLQAGDPLLSRQFTSVRALHRLSRHVAQRMRAYTLPANTYALVGQAVGPRDLVDVLVSFPAKDKGKRRIERTAVTLLQRVPVLATGRVSQFTPASSLEPADRAYGNVTLLLTPEEAEALTLAKTVGRVVLTLRNQDDLDDDRGLDRAYSDSDTLLDGDRHRLRDQRRFDVIRAAKEARPR